MNQLRGAAGRGVPLAMFGAPNDLHYWGAAEDLGYGQLALLLPTQPWDQSLRVLDDYADLVAQYRGELRATLPERRDVSTIIFSVYIQSYIDILSDQPGGWAPRRRPNLGCGI